MKNIPDFYILGLPVDTPIGQCSFIKVKEYPDLIEFLNYIQLSRQHFINTLKEQHTDVEELKIIENISLFQLVSETANLKAVYQIVFSFVFNDEEIFNNITEELFNDYRSLILKMNGMKEEYINPNPEIQKWIDKSKKFKAGNQEPFFFEDMVSSVVGYNGLSYSDINEMTIYQLTITFQRIAKIKNYDTSTLFSTVATEKMSIEQWCGHIDLFKEENHGISKDEFDDKSGSLFN